jgi:hypothetical protein
MRSGVLSQEDGGLGCDVAAEVGQHHAEAGSADVRGGDVSVRRVEAEESWWASTAGFAVAQMLHQVEGLQVRDAARDGWRAQAGVTDEICFGAGAVLLEKLQEAAGVRLAKLRGARRHGARGEGWGKCAPAHVDSPLLPLPSKSCRSGSVLHGIAVLQEPLQRQSLMISIIQAHRVH